MEDRLTVVLASHLAVDEGNPEEDREEGDDSAGADDSSSGGGVRELLETQRRGTLSRAAIVRGSLRRSRDQARGGLCGTADAYLEDDGQSHNGRGQEEDDRAGGEGVREGVAAAEDTELDGQVDDRSEATGDAGRDTESGKDAVVQDGADQQVCTIEQGEGRASRDTHVAIPLPPFQPQLTASAPPVATPTPATAETIEYCPTKKRVRTVRRGAGRGRMQSKKRTDGGRDGPRVPGADHEPGRRSDDGAGEGQKLNAGVTLERRGRNDLCREDAVSGQRLGCWY